MCKYGVNLFALAILLTAIPHGARAQCEPGSATARLNFADVDALISNNGVLFHGDQESYFRVPKNGTANALFASALWLGGKTIDGEIRIAAQTYFRQEFFPGPIGESGPLTDCADFDYVWLVSIDDVQHFNSTGLANYDLANWPTGLGAPTLDSQGSLISILDEPLSTRLDRTIDLDSGERPAILGHQMAWWIMNDAAGVHEGTGSPPMGVEVHGSAGVAALEGPLSTSVILKYRIFNRSDSALTDVYTGRFVDPDLGAFHDDYVGSDSTLSLAYAYNSDNDDEGSGGYGVAPPAVGVVVISGPAVASPGDTASVNGTLIPDYRNLKMSNALYFHDGGRGPTSDPRTLEDYHNFLTGLWRDGSQPTFGGDGTDAFTSRPTSFLYTGTPPDYWTEFNTGSGEAIPPADRRFIAGTGPFELPVGGEQELIEAFVWSRGSSNLDSVTKLKQDVETVRDVVLSGEYAAPNFVAGVPSFQTVSSFDIELQQPLDTVVAVSLSNVGTVGLEWDVSRWQPPLQDFLTVANANGLLVPPDYAAYAEGLTGFPHGGEALVPTPGYQQAGSNATWIIHAGKADSSYENFLSRAFSKPDLKRSDYEIRFTEGGAKAILWFQDKSVIDVPFELWQVGDASLENSADDIRMIPLLCEICDSGNPNGVFDIYGDHAVSPGSDDPASDWIYFIRPIDETTGESGYLRFFDGDETQFGAEVFRRIQLVLLDGGTSPPYVAELPETGTVFRIVTTDDFISIESQNGLIASGGADQFSIDLSLTGLAPGVYRDTVRIETSDPLNQSVAVPVSITIAGSHQDMPVTSTGTLYSFENDGGPFLQASFSELGSVTSMSASLFVDQPVDLREAAAKVFATRTIGGEFAADLTFFYSEADLDRGGVKSWERDLRILQRSAGRWQLIGGSVDSVANTIFVEGIITTGTFAIADPAVLITNTDTDATQPELVTALTSIYPNPSSGAFTVSFDVAPADKYSKVAGSVRMELFDIVGRRRAILLEQPIQPGSHSFSFDEFVLASGLYFVRLTAGNRTSTKSFAVAR